MTTGKLILTSLTLLSLGACVSGGSGGFYPQQGQTGFGQIQAMRLPPPPRGVDPNAAGSCPWDRTGGYAYNGRACQELGRQATFQQNQGRQPYPQRGAPQGYPMNGQMPADFTGNLAANVTANVITAGLYCLLSDDC